MQRKKRVLPSAETLREFLEYNPITGNLTWKDRGLQHFGSRQDMNAWNARMAGTKAGALKTQNKAYGPYHVYQIRVSGVLHYSHRIAWKIMTGEEPPLHLSHKNGDGTDNSWENIIERITARNSQQAYG